MYAHRIASLGVALLLAACSPSDDAFEQYLLDHPTALQQAVDKYLSEHPELLLSAIEEHPEAFMTAAGNAAAAQKQLAQQRRMDEAFANPKSPRISADRVIFGAPEAAITIVEYSDFQCPYCARVTPTLARVMTDYNGKVRVLYKHLPLDFHDQARSAARYYEAIGLQDRAKAKAFHDAVFKDQKGLAQSGEAFLQATAAGLALDMEQLQRDLDSDLVTARIEGDIAEAKDFGFQGTPGFLINGVPLVGSKPYDEFKAIIDRHLSEG